MSLSSIKTLRGPAISLFHVPGNLFIGEMQWQHHPRCHYKNPA